MAQTISIKGRVRIATSRPPADHLLSTDVLPVRLLLDTGRPPLATIHPPNADRPLPDAGRPPPAAPTLRTAQSERTKQSGRGGRGKEKERGRGAERARGRGAGRARGKGAGRVRGRGREKNRKGRVKKVKRK